MRRTIIALLALTAITLFAAAARSDAATKTADSSAPAIITMGEDMRFSPAKIVIHRGQTVAWQNMSHNIHNIVDIPAQSPRAGIMTLPKGAVGFDSGLMNYGQTWVQTFSVPGTYKYACTLHIANKMFGEIVVK